MKIQYRVTYLRHGVWDSLDFHCRDDAESFIEWGTLHNSAFIRATLSEVDA